MAAARERGPVPVAGEFRAMSGRGVEATLDGTRLAVGGPGLLRDRGLEVPADLREEAAAWRSRGASVLYLVRDGTGGRRVCP